MFYLDCVFKKMSPGERITLIGTGRVSSVQSVMKSCGQELLISVIRHSVQAVNERFMSVLTSTEAESENQTIITSSLSLSLVLNILTQSKDPRSR